MAMQPCSPKIFSLLDLKDATLYGLLLRKRLGENHWDECWVALHGVLLFLYKRGTPYGIPFGDPYAYIPVHHCFVESNDHTQPNSKFSFGFSLNAVDHNFSKNHIFLTASHESRNTWMIVLLNSNLTKIRDFLEDPNPDPEQSDKFYDRLKLDTIPTKSLSDRETRWDKTLNKIRTHPQTYSCSVFARGAEYELEPRAMHRNDEDCSELDEVKSEYAIAKAHIESRRSVRIFVLSWNMGAKDLFDWDPDPYGGPPRVRKSEVQKIAEVIPDDYDIYVIGVQECISELLFNLIQKHLGKHKCQRVPMKPDTDRVWGRGDGSFINPKFTGIALYVSERVIANVELENSAAVSLGMLEGSKGGAGFAMRIYDSTMAFVTAHLPANSAENRRMGYSHIIEKMGNALGDKHFGLLEQFHHVVFFGDLNYRLTDIDPERALEYIRRNQLASLRWHDGLVDDMRREKVFYRFREPIPVQEGTRIFYPTYKKYEDRPCGEDKNCDDPDWVHKEYRTMYKEPWYKRGNVHMRLPSFTDRILVHSIKDMSTDVHPEVSQFSTSHNYGALNGDLTGSDHTAIYGSFKLESPPVLPLKPSDDGMTYDVALVKVHVLTGFSKDEVLPKHIRVLFPAPFEDGNITPESSQFHPSAIRRQPRPYSYSENNGVPSRRQVEESGDTMSSLSALNPSPFSNRSTSPHKDKPHPHTSTETSQARSFQSTSLLTAPKGRTRRTKSGSGFDRRLLSISRRIPVPPRQPAPIRQQFSSSAPSSPPRSTARRKGSPPRSAGRRKHSPPKLFLDPGVRFSQEIKTVAEEDEGDGQEAEPLLSGDKSLKKSDADADADADAAPTPQAAEKFIHEVMEVFYPGYGTSPSGGRREEYSSPSFVTSLKKLRNGQPDSNGHYPSLDHGGHIRRPSDSRQRATLHFGGDEDLHFRWRGIQSAPTLHLLLRIHTQDLDGQCCISLPIESFQNEETLSFVEPITQNGLPVRNRLSKIVKVKFMLRLNLDRHDHSRRRRLNHF